mmetsp:Transcript_58902/g.162837  ORF Transcript_58902/g.162837 Transcript_58902/m.162837 type:complete len:323 (-) Transcript_58902:313-1281(-)
MRIHPTCTAPVSQHCTADCPAGTGRQPTPSTRTRPRRRLRFLERPRRPSVSPSSVVARFKRGRPRPRRRRLGARGALGRLLRPRRRPLGLRLGGRHAPPRIRARPRRVGALALAAPRPRLLELLEQQPLSLLGALEARGDRRELLQDARHVPLLLGLALPQLFELLLEQLGLGLRVGEVVLHRPARLLAVVVARRGGLRGKVLVAYHEALLRDGLVLPRHLPHKRLPLKLVRQVLVLQLGDLPVHPLELGLQVAHVLVALGEPRFRLVRLVLPAAARGHRVLVPLLHNRQIGLERAGQVGPGGVHGHGLPLRARPRTQGDPN